MLVSFQLLTIGSAITLLGAKPVEAGNVLPQSSPAWLNHVAVPTAGVVKQVPRPDQFQTGDLKPVDLDLSMYPEILKQPPVNHPEVQAVVKAIDWNKVPKIAPRIVKDWTFDIKSYDSDTDKDCWWSATSCKTPKADYLPEDIYYCPRAGDWGLNYDDGPYKMMYPTSDQDKLYDQPRFYNYLVANNMQRATLFFVGSNVAKFPDAAQRALNNGHTICSHTWSHPQMTSLTNEEVVAQLYWTHRAIKQVLGITPKCWRPPYGDVDDRVRAIAHQMGMRTILWDQDSYDWNMVGGQSGGKLQPAEVHAFFQKWIDNAKLGNDTRGHITLEHESSKNTIDVAEKWLPKLQETFNVMPIHQCINDVHPYWEQAFTYPSSSDKGNGKGSVLVGVKSSASNIQIQGVMVVLAMMLACLLGQ
ncbi:glycoside hydrolase/deacetylase [Hesseltinella vesiculosa]|uniref:Glycoside hydrolase/deacetylase n=1 Tax=Hesseltinella vesiculosa TaxID=101127 RepID=A0A1X2GIG4_9FUNG|nr:glycoside hydrolase/deacetylase [Hesseltinella vesiculosa]